MASLGHRGEHDSELQKLVHRMNPPRVVLDNASCETATVLKVDSVNKRGLLLEVVQILTDLELNIHKAYFSSDGGWFMDVFHVTNAEGGKLESKELSELIQKRVLDCFNEHNSRVVGVHSASESTSIEFTAMDRPGLMSEIFALLTRLQCNVVAAELWTHNMRVACLVCVTDQLSGGPIQDSDRLASIKESICRVLRGVSWSSTRAGTMDFSTGITHTERRLHQMMFAGRDYEAADGAVTSQTMVASPSTSSSCEGTAEESKISVENCRERGYSVVSVECQNRTKLLFDTVCTLTDMDYVVFHATIDSNDDRAYQEYYIRHADGCTLNSDAERQRVIQCLRAAIRRRVSKGVRLELCTNDRIGLLSDVTRIFREHGLSVTRADVSTKGNMARNVFYVTDVAGNRVDDKCIEAVRREIGQAVLRVAPTQSLPLPCKSASGKARFSLANFLGKPSQILSSLGLIKSCS
ncbi:hypothetical protein GOP47_0002649 [Adiantum capillus-veneris]|uniref:ACT domain-containing protein n=1 Tax=Adiantum capillus-veneris TaxID=13818 RepID=A0A9D4VAH3_ADICA|nr:hypothetical protein GOP47_0002649 [Adiantum capillus-veneris]